MKSQKDESLDSLDKESFKAKFEEAIPDMVAVVSDLLEVRPPRIPKKAKREIAEEAAWGFDASIPHLKTLEDIDGDVGQLDKVYSTFEGLVRTLLRRTKHRLKPREDAIEYALRKYWASLKPPYFVKRLKQFRVTREGVERLVTAVLSRPGGEEAARQLIEKFNGKHLKEYMRYTNTLRARLKSYQNINLKRMTSQNVTRLTGLYGDAAAAFEKRLRLLVGLNHIARGEATTYDELRRLGYNELLQAVDSPSNPLLHFLRGSVDRHVRNAIMHAGVSSTPSKGVVTFVDYSPGRRKENTVVWTMAGLYRRTVNLLLTVNTVAQLEDLLIFAFLYNTVAVVNYLRANPPSGTSAGSAVTSV